jgi:hypothetical protein
MINVFTQVAGWRYAKEWGLLRWVLTAFLGGFLIVVGIEAAYASTAQTTFTEFIGGLVLNSLTYIALGYCYFHFINLGETARRIRLLRELLESDDGLSRNEILQRYDASYILKVRLRRMVNNRQIIIRDNRYYIGKPIMLYLARIMVAMKLVLLGRRSEFE